MAMDPMQRLLLEVTYEAFENSGLPLSKVSGSKTSCYVGCFTKDYEEMQRRDMELAPKYQSTGASQTMLSNRLSYFFNLKGPSVSLDTACSSGLVAVHLACQSLQTGESTMAVAGGSNLILSPDIQIEMCDMHFLSPDSISHAFDARANGYARGEGVGAIILKPLDLALRDNDPIRAVIRGTAASSDGRTPGITMPSKDAQIDLIRSAYLSAGLDVDDTGYFEAHGTGTAAGDPIETGAIGEVFAASRTRHHAEGINEAASLLVGSIKTNIGHLEGASGIAGIIKATLSVEKGMIAPNLWFERGNPDIDFEKWRIEVPTEPKDWPSHGLRRASINSFGYGGTNAHVILDDAYHVLQHLDRSIGRTRADSGFVSPVSPGLNHSFVTASRPRVFLQSANDEKSLIRMGQDLASYLQEQAVFNEEELLDNLAYTLSERRSRFAYTSAVVASNKHDLQTKLQSIRATSAASTTPPRIGFIFTGQGAQWWGMGRELLQYPVFRRTLQKCDTAVAKLGSEWSLMEELLKPQATSRVNEAAFSQPLCTALQVALVDLLASWNILPQCVVGHSSGEIAAAYATGALGLQSAMSVAYFRGALSSKVKGMGYEGRMMAAGLSEEEVILEIEKASNGTEKVVVACVNSPRSVTISGDAAAIENLHKALEAKGVFARVLQVDTAYHSHHMQAIAHEYLARLKEANVTVLSSDSRVTMASSVTEEIVENKSLGAEYWVSNLVQSVRFSGALTKLCTSDAHAVDILLEVGPHGLFKAPVKEILQAAFGETSQIRYLSTLMRNKPADLTALEAAGQLVSCGHVADLRAANFPNAPKQALSVLTDLPQYPWNHTRRYWYESRLSRDYRFRRFARTDLLGAPVSDWNPMEPRFRNFLRLREQPWLKDHVVQGVVLFPACGYLCMAIEACRQMAVISPSTFLPPRADSVMEYRLREISISRALVVPEADEGVEIVLSMRCPPQDGSSPAGVWSEFCIFSYTADGGWAENCRGLVSVSAQATTDDELAQECLADWTAAHSGGVRGLEAKTFYRSVDALGLTYGPTFQGLQDISVNSAVRGQAAGVVQVTDTKATIPKAFEHDRLLHPATLDTFLQLGLAALGGAEMSQLRSAMVPTFIEEMTVSADIAAQIGDRLNILATARRLSARDALGDIVALDPNTSRPVVLMDGFKFVTINSSSDSSDVEAPPKHCYQAVWEPDVELVEPSDLNRELQAVPRVDNRSRSVKDLELLSYYLVDKAIREVDESEMSAMLPHHKKLYQALCDIRGTVLDKTHPAQTEEWQKLHSPEVTSKLEAMIKHYNEDQTAYEGRLLVRIGQALPSIFRQEVEPLTLMTHENLLENYYGTAVGMPNVYAQISRFTSMLSHKYPNLDYLEIGAGTGGATVPTLNGLRGYEGLHTYPRLKSYTYTDISSYFFDRAAEKFDEFSQFINFRKLDVEDDPETQNFVPGSYDVIVAANVLHATTDMHRTMTHVRKLLRPGGKLILLEMTNRLIAGSVIFGTLPGWWNAVEPWRVGGPLLTESQWEDVLQATGFSGLQASSPDALDPLEEGTRLMIATAVETKPVISHGLATPPENPRFFIVCPDSGIRMSRLDIPLALKTRLERAGHQTQLTTLNKLNPRVLVHSICISFVELDDALMANPTPREWDVLHQITDSAEALIWVTRGGASSTIERPELAIFSALARTIRAEHDGFPCITVDLDAREQLPARQVAELLLRLYNKQLGPDRSAGTLDSEFIEQHGVLRIKRAIEDDKANEFLTARTHPEVLPPKPEDVLLENRPLKSCTIDASADGPLVFEENLELALPLQSGQVEIKIQVTSLGPRDVATIKGEGSDSKLGHECAGIVTQVGVNVKNVAVGDRVVGWYPGTFATRTRIPAAFVSKMPDGASFETAATLPLSHATAQYALSHIAHLEDSEAILIHEAADAVGRAAIEISSRVGANIFATVRSEEERALLIEHYGLETTRIFSSRDIKFVAGIRRATKGRGVDVVLNTMTGEALQATFSCVAPFGRFVDLNVRSRDRLEMAPFERNVSFSSVDMTLLYNQRPKLASRMFQEAIKSIMAAESLHNLSVEAMPWSKFDQAVKMLQDGQHHGPVVMVPKAGDQVLVSHFSNTTNSHNQTTNTLQVAQKPPSETSLDPCASYLLVGGLGGLGRSISHWLIAHGAKNLIFISRSGAVTPASQSFIASLHASGIRTSIIQCDVSDALELSIHLSTTLETLPPIKGVIQGAMALHDALFANMTEEQWTSTLRSKVHGSKNLHDMTLSQPLDFFILLSSLHSFIGNPGQANYAAACAYQVALAQHRTQHSLPGLSIDLGIVSEVGYVVEQSDTPTTSSKKVRVQDFKRVNEKEMLALLELGIRNPSMGHIVSGLDYPRHAAHTVRDDLPFFARDPVLSHLDYLRAHLHRETKSGGANDGTATTTTSTTLSLPAQLAAASCSSARKSVVTHALLKKLARSLMMDPAEIDPSRGMSAYGTDSLVAVEMKNWIQRETHVSVSVFEILQSSSIGGLVERIVAKMEGAVE